MESDVPVIWVNSFKFSPGELPVKDTANTRMALSAVVRTGRIFMLDWKWYRNPTAPRQFLILHNRPGCFVGACTP